MSETIYIVTGANRGIGLGLVTALAARSNTTVVAAVRNLASAKHLSEIQAASGSKVLLVKLDSEVHTDAAAVVEELKSKHGITKLDIVISNAGIASVGTVAETSPKQLLRHVEVNYIAPIALFGATLPLLKQGSNPKFVAISTGAASIGDMEKVPMPNTAYGASKAALNFAMKKAHMENPDVIVYPLSPGWVQTDMGNAGAKAAGMDGAPVKLHESIEGILKNIDNATKEHTSGTFQSFDDAKFAW